MPSSLDLSRRRGFTLIEITIVIFLILLLLAVGVPSLTGQLSRQRLQHSLDRIEALAITAQKLSATENRAYALVWSRDGVVRLYPADLPADDRKKHEPAASLVPAGPTSSREERYTLVRDASLTNDPGNVWTFWPTGNCEPVDIRYEGPSGHWDVAFNPLSARASLRTFIAR